MAKLLNIIVTLFVASALAYVSQISANSGEAVYANVVVKIVISVIAYLSVCLFLSKRDLWPPSRWLIVLAVMGTLTWLLLATIYEGYMDYSSLKTRGILDEGQFFRNYLGFAVSRLLLLVPVESLIFLVVFVPFRFVLGIASKAVTRSRMVNPI